MNKYLFKTIITISCFILLNSTNLIAQYPILVNAIDKSLLEIYDYSGPVAIKHGEVIFSWTSEHLNISGNIIDKNLVIPDKSSNRYSKGYNYDSIEFWINKHQYCAGFTEDGDNYVLWLYSKKEPSPSGKLKLKKTATGYEFKISIPWKELDIIAKENNTFKLAFGINSHDATGDKGSQLYIPEDYVWGDISSFASVVLIKNYIPGKYQFVFSKEKCNIEYPDTSEMQQINANINISEKKGIVNKKVLGVCAHKPPWPSSVIKSIYPFLNNGSIRVWARGNKDWDSQWGKLVKSVEPEWVLGFTDNVWHPEKVRYNTASDNNLFDYQQPEAILKRLKYVQKITDYNLSAYEIWNEPEFKVNGGWAPTDMARYVTDCSKLIRTNFPKLNIGAFLCDSKWNKEFLKNIPRNIISFVDHHYYNTFWFHVGYNGDTAYTGKVIYTPQLKKRIDNDLNSIRKFAPNRMDLVCSEWGIHPKTYKAPYDVCHDIGAVIYHASTVLAFMDAELFSAQFFKLSEPSIEMDHFRLINPFYPQTATGNLLLFRSFGELFKGERILLNIKAPYFSVTGIESEKYPHTLSAPVIEGAASLWDDEKHLCVILLNKHIKERAKININGLNRQWNIKNSFAIISDNIDSTNIFKKKLHLTGTNLEIPERSVVFILFEKSNI